ncbi:MAG: phage tail protein [Janthinobacterium lividum]
MPTENKLLASRSSADQSTAESSLVASTLSVQLVFDEITLTLKQSDTPLPVLRQPVWHYVEPMPGVDVRVQSDDENHRLVRVSVESDAPGWNPRWPHWSYAVRRTPEDLGGDAMSAQDALSEDESALTLLLLAGERREATLEFHTLLDGETAPGDYRFDVVLTDIETGAETRTYGLARLRHPEANYLQHLPALYTSAPPRLGQNAVPYEDPPFFERFLRGFEDSGEPLGDMLSNLYRYFDADSAPADFLPWLATWVALDLDENWLQLKRRRLIKEAIWLYRWRGTRLGLSRYLEIYSGVKPEINDQPFSGMQLGPTSILGQNTVLGGVQPHTFVVTLAVPDPSAINIETLRRIIESQKPAHTAYEVRVIEREAGGLTTLEALSSEDLSFDILEETARAT